MLFEPMNSTDAANMVIFGRPAACAVSTKCRPWMVSIR